jgi:hypothetical protein
MNTGHKANPNTGFQDARTEGLRLEAISKSQLPDFGINKFNRLQKRKEVLKWPQA